MMHRTVHPGIRRSRGFVAGTALAALAALGATAPAQVLKDSLPEIEGVGITEHRGAQVPGDVALVDHEGRACLSGDFFDGKRPVLLVIGYYDCPLLCLKMFSELQATLNGINWTAGEEYRVLAVSIDHQNSPAMAREKRETYGAGLKNPPTPDGWVFTVGSATEVRRLADVVGYRYRYIPETGEFSHPAALIFLTPRGVVNTYLERLVYPPRDVKMALLEAAEGRTGSIFDRIQHFCFRYDPKTGRYTQDAMRVMQLGATVTVGALGVSIGLFALAGARRRHALLVPTGEPGGAGRVQA